MAALLRGLQAGRALRNLGCVAFQAAAAPQCGSISGCGGARRGLHSAALLLRAHDDSKTPPSSSTSYHEHYQAHSTSQDTTASHGHEGASASAHEGSAGGATAGQEDGQANTSYQDQSGEQGEDYETEEQLAERILSASLDFVHMHGWTIEAIAAGAETLGLSSATTGMFYNGAGDLVLHFVAQCNAQLTEILAEQHKQIQLGQAEQKKTAQFLRDAVETRLRMHIPYMDTWPQAMSILILPHNIPHSLKHLSTLMDDIWYYAGDRSTDMNWYTKRAALTGIYNTTELVMLQDSSEDYQDTWTFLDNRIQDVVNMANTAKQVSSTGEAVAQGLMGAAVTLKNITGLNQRR